jgi:hypothetical protein
MKKFILIAAFASFIVACALVGVIGDRPELSGLMIPAAITLTLTALTAYAAIKFYGM